MGSDDQASQVVGPRNAGILQVGQQGRYVSVELLDMSETRAEAEKAIAKSRWEVPAQEQTRQEKIRQDGQTRREMIGAVPRMFVLAVLMGTFAWRLLVDHVFEPWLLVASGVVLGVPKLWDFIKDAIKSGTGLPTSG